jgi:hypothetical protein
VEGDLELPRLPAIPGHQGVGVVESKINGAGVMIISEDRTRREDKPDDTSRKNYYS